MPWSWRSTALRPRFEASVYVEDEGGFGAGEGNDKQRGRGAEGGFEGDDGIAWADDVLTTDV